MIGVPRVSRFRWLGVFRTVTIAAGMFIVACAKDALVTGPKNSLDARLDVVGPAAASGPSVVISQVYGGGGNAGATLRNDFIEIHNRGTDAVDLTGWSVQYASAAGAFSGITTLSGTLAPGRYALIQEAKGSGGTVDLPTPEFTGTIAMSATAGKVALVKSGSLLTCGAAGSN